MVIWLPARRPWDIPPFKEENPRQPPWRGDGAVALVAPGGKCFFEPGLGGGREWRLVLPLTPGKVTSDAEGPDECLGVAAGTARTLTGHEMEPEFDAGRDWEYPVHGLGH